MLDPLHGDGYQLWSGIGGHLPVILSLVGLFWHRHNCHARRCWRVVRHGQTHCPKHVAKSLKSDG